MLGSGIGSVVCVFFFFFGSIPIVRLFRFMVYGFGMKSKDGEEGGLGGGKVAVCDCWWRKRKGHKINKRSHSETQKRM